MKLDTNRLRAALAQEKTAIHCKTPEAIKALFEVMQMKDRQAAADYWAKKKEQACFLVDKDLAYRGFAAVDFYQAGNYFILSLDDFLVPDEPLMCKALGVKANQPFKIGKSLSTYRINAEGVREFKQGERWESCAVEQDLAHIINNPHLVSLVSIWTDADIEDAKAVRRLFPDMAWVAREENGRVWLYKTKPTRCGGCFVEGEPVRSVNTTHFESVTWDNSPVKLEDIV